MYKFKPAFRSFLMSILCLVMLINTAAAAESDSSSISPDTQRIFLANYQLTDEKIVPGHNFTLSLMLKNTDTEDASHVIVDVMNPDGVSPVYGTISQAVVDIPAESITEVTFEYIALEGIPYPTMDFQVSIQDQDVQGRTILRAPVGSNSPFNIIATAVPTKVTSGDSITCSMTFKFQGKEKIDHLTARMDANGTPVHTVDIGPIPRDTTKTQSLFADFKNPGEYLIELYLDYQDESGESHSVLVETSLIEVTANGFDSAFHPNSSNTPENQTVSPAGSYDNTTVLVISGSLIIVIFLIIVFLTKKQK